MWQLYMTLNPMLIPPDTSVQEGAVPSHASAEFIHFTQRWIRSARSATKCSDPNRVIAAAPDIAGMLLLLHLIHP